MRSGIAEAAVVRAYNELVVEGDEAAQAWKAEHPSYETAEFFWIDRMVKGVTFGKHEGFILPDIPRCQYRGVEKTGDDFTMIIHWKWGQKSTVDSGVERLKDVPRVIADIYRKKR